MSDSSAAEWLLQEALDYLAIDSLAVYELLGLLHVPDCDLADKHAKALVRLSRGPLGEVAFEPSECGAYLGLISSDAEEPLRISGCDQDPDLDRRETLIAACGPAVSVRTCDNRVWTASVA